MKVLVIIASGDVGGGTNHVLQILRGLKDLYSFGLVTQADSYLLREARALGLPCFGLDFFSNRLDPRVPFGLRRIITRFEPTLMHVHGGRAGFFQALAGTKVPTIYTVHGFHFLHKPPLFRWLAAGAERRIIHRASHIIFVCRYDQNVAERYRFLRNRQANSIIYNGIAAPGVMISPQNKQKVVGFIGRLEYQKDPLLFLDSLELLSDWKAVVIGTGPLERRVREEVVRRGLTERVTIKGEVSHQETLETMSRLHTLVMTSRWEGFPLLPIEAMWLGVPVVATDVGGIREIIQDGKSGILIEGRNATKIAGAIKLLFEDMLLRTGIIAQAQAHVRTDFSEDAMFSQLRKVYERVGQVGKSAQERSEVAS